MNDDNFCSQCGEKLVLKESIKCQCGYVLVDADKFCSGCGLPRKEKAKDYLEDGGMDVSNKSPTEGSRLLKDCTQEGNNKDKPS